MKKFILVSLLLCILTPAFTQVDSIKLVAPGVLTEVNFKVNTSPTITYQRTLSWINEFYKNPEKVISGKSDGQNITISGYSENASYSTGMVTQYYDISYHIYIVIKDSLINFRMVIDNLYYQNKPTISGVQGFFNKNGEYKLKLMNVAKSSLENTINKIFLSYYNKFQNVEISSDEAISELKKYKDKLDLQLITQEEYDKKKLELSKYIK